MVAPSAHYSKRMKIQVNMTGWTKRIHPNGQAVWENLMPTQDFWAVWREHKAELRGRGYRVFKTETERWGVQFFAKNGEMPNIEIDDQEEVPAIKKNTLAPLIDDTNLLDYQKPLVQNLVSAFKTNRVVVDGCETGTGKTYMILAMAREMNRRLFVVCPKAAIPSWRRASRHMYWDDEVIEVINWELLRYGRTKYGSWQRKEVGSGGRSSKHFKWHVPHKAILVFDEAHYAKSNGTKNSQMLIDAKLQGYDIAMMSATMASSPMEMRAIGFALGLHDLKDYWEWATRHGVIRTHWGMEFRGGKHHLEKIHRQIFPRLGNRVKKDDIPGFPECETHCSVIDFGDEATRQIRDVYDSMQSEIEEIIRNKRPATCILAAQLRACQAAELQKMPVIAERAKELVEEGSSVAIFVNFTDSRLLLLKHLNTDCSVHGDQHPDERQGRIDAFNRDQRRIIVLNVQAGGVSLSLHDLHGRHPRHAIIMPPRRPIDCVQALGRVHRAGAKTKAIQEIVFAGGTIEEDVMERLETKLNNLSTVMDGDTLYGFLSERSGFGTVSHAESEEVRKPKIRIRRKG